jgi:hypothetical protein
MDRLARNSILRLWLAASPRGKHNSRMLRFGPYHPPRFKIGGTLDCEYAGTLRIVAISDAPQQWPLGVVWGHRIPVLCGELVRAVKIESAVDVAEAWGVGISLVTKWRKALRVTVTEGEHRRRSENIRASDPARAQKIAAAKLGKPRPARVRRALRRANLGRKPSAETLAKRSATHKRIGTRPPWLKPAWTAREDRIVRRLSAEQVAKITGRSLSAVYSRRAKLLGKTIRDNGSSLENAEVNWTTKADALVRVVHPALAAERLGISVEAVTARRAELGLPSVELQFARRPHHGGGKLPLAPEQVEVIRSNPIDVAAKLLGKSRMSVSRYRQSLGIAKRLKQRRRPT